MIIADHEEIGTVWLEKTDASTEMAMLGILIGDEGKHGKGIGVSAIKLAINHSKDRLGFRNVRANVRLNNTRAISCYRKSGFTIISKGVKIRKGLKIPFATMEIETA